MVTNTLQETAAFCRTTTGAQDALAHELLEQITSKWPLWVLHVLAQAGGPLRFSRVLERVDGISQKMLTQTLRMLEKNGLVTRTLFPQVPPRVEYELTTLGGELLIQLRPLWHWIGESLPLFEAAREKAGSK